MEPDRWEQGLAQDEEWAEDKAAAAWADLTWGLAAIACV